MALTKVNRGGLNTGVADSSNATFLTATAAEGVTLAGTLAVTGIHTVGVNAVATSEGGSATTIISQGLAKCWVDITSPTTSSGASITLQDAFNTTSMIDNGTGQIMCNFANNMASVNYVVQICGGQTNNLASVDTGTQAADQVRVETFNVSEAKVNTDTMVVIHGDIA